MIYLDNSATTRVDPRVLAVMAPYLDGEYGNASSLHGAGRSARRALDRSRDQVAAALACDPAEVIFCSGGTEADNLAIRGVAAARPGCHLVTVATEHHAVLHTVAALEASGHPVSILPVDASGRVSPALLAEVLRPDTGLVSVMLANNEIGTVQAVAELASVTHRLSGALFHTDAVQAVGKMPVSLGALGVDLLTLTAHKVHGPKGAGALLARRDVALVPQQTGGSHERGRRAGTENVAAIVGLGEALAIASADLERGSAHMAEMRTRLQDGLAGSVAGLIPTGHPRDRIPSVASFLVDDVEGEDLIVALDLAGVCCSGGAACAAGSMEPSHVIAALGYTGALARSPLRLSVSRFTTPAEVDEAVPIIGRVIDGLRSRGRQRAAGRTESAPV